ncbi:MAG: endospore germination permease [Firmicutes bacterium]|nr:endospore germination permease [Bacillota bacterium]
MVEDNDRIGGLGLAFLLAAGLVEAGTLKLPSQLAASVGRDSWLVPPVLVVACFISLAFFYWLGRRFPEESVFEYSPRLIGRIPAQLLALVLNLYWLLLVGRMLRDFSDTMRLSLVEFTPAEIVCATLLLAAAYLARMGLEPLTRGAFVIVLFTTPLIVLMSLVILVNANFGNLWPILTKGIWPVLKEGFLTSGSAEQLSALFVLVPFLTHPRKTLPAGSLALGTMLVADWLVVTGTQTVFSIPHLAELRIPILPAIQSVELPVMFLERLSSVFIAAWIARAFITIAFTLWLAATGLKLWTGSDTHQVYVFPLLPVIFVIAFLPLTMEAQAVFADFLTIVGFYLQMLLPPLLLLVAAVRGQGKAQGG